MCKQIMYTDNVFTYEHYKHVFPIHMFCCPLYKSLPTNQLKLSQINNLNRNKDFFIDCRRINFKNRNYDIKNITIENINIYKLRLKSLGFIYNNYDELFSKCKYHVFIFDQFNPHRTSKKIFDCIIQNKFIILKKENNWANRYLVKINYPNYIHYNNYQDLQKTMELSLTKKCVNFDLNKYFIKEHSLYEYKKFIKMSNDTIIVIGNGPSSKDLDFTKITYPTVGMNIAFRYWYKINWFLIFTVVWILH